MTTTTQVSPPKWWIESPQVIPEDSPFFLCDVCKHINFKYLIFESPIWVVPEEMPLDSYSRILEKQHCAFCRLLKHTIDNIFGTGALPTEHEGTAIMISMIVSPEQFDKTASDPRQLLLWVKPNPLKDGKTPPLKIQHVAEGSWLDSNRKG